MILDVEPDGATPLTNDEAAGLIPLHITTRGELNLWEQTNILVAEKWAFRTRLSTFYEEKFIKSMHKRMFDQTWEWAGEYRQTNKNIGVLAGWELITEIRKLCDDVEFWMNAGAMSADEIAARFHHRLVWVHPFANGNGRHARLMADVCLRSLGAAPFSWGRGSIAHANEAINQAGVIRSRYISALRLADGGDYSALFDFVRS